MGGRVLVTGGARGIGAAIVRELAGLGHAVDFTYNSSAEAAEGLASEIGAAHPGAPVTAVQCDLGDRQAVEAFAGPGSGSVVPAAAREVLARYDSHAQHYERVARHVPAGTA